MKTNAVRSNLVALRQHPDPASELSAEALAFASASGDPVAVAQLFDRFRRPVARYLRRALANASDVEDCLQATVLDIARGQARFEGRSSVSTWLLGVATNVVRHHHRSVGRRAKLQRALRLVPPTGAPEPDRTAVARQTLQRLSEALAVLPDERRLTFVLCELEGLSAREAAQVPGTTETAVWKRVSDARKALLKVALEVEP